MITVYGGTDQWKQRVGFHDPKHPYLILLGSSGNVVWRYAGSLDEEPYKALSSESRLSFRELKRMGLYRLHGELWCRIPCPWSSISSHVLKISNK